MAPPPVCGTTANATPVGGTTAAPGAERVRSSWRPSFRPPHLLRDRLERAGWLTAIDFVENHRRDVDGRLTGVAAYWIVTAEHADDRRVVSARGRSPRAAWSTLWKIVLEDRFHDRPQRADTHRARWSNDRHASHIL